MNEIDTGGPAFPCDVFDPDVGGPEQHEGMTLRDCFAAKALPALIAHPQKDGVNCGPDNIMKMAQWSYEYADAMLKARQS